MMPEKTTFFSFMKNRLLIYIIISAMIPSVCIFYYLFCKKKQIDRLSQKIKEIQLFSASYKKKQGINLSIRKIFTNANHQYIDHHLESLTFLDNEKKALEKIISSDFFSGDEKILRRHHYLTGKENCLVFRENGIETAEGIEEMSEALSHTVEIDADDLKNILFRIEGEELSLSPPQMLITDFFLKRKSHPNEGEIFELDIQLIKREFVS